MTQLSWTEIQNRAAEFASKWQGETYEKGESQSFWSDFLAVYGIDRRRHGAFFEYAIKKGSGGQGFIDMFWPGKLLAEQKSGGRDLQKASIQAYEYLETMPDHDLPEGIVVSDFKSFIFIQNDGTNTKTEFTLADFPKHVKLFGFLVNRTSKQLVEEDPVNRNAAEAMARLHNQLRDDNYTGHELELLLVRLVFCMFADDSGIFDHGLLQEYLTNYTSEDGSDIGGKLIYIFQTLNTPVEQRQNSLDEAIASLPYVNGGLFAEIIRTPQFSGAMRKELLSAMKLDWSQVSPAIFGSMFQGVMDAKQRRNLGAHYTSEKNILRVIKPLFLDDLYKEFAIALKAGPRKKFDELHKLQDKIARLKFLDPACGCGNFLVITYRELRHLEHKIVAQLAKGRRAEDISVDLFANAGEGVSSLKVNVDQMYGIEIEEFPSLIAQTALWLTDHQMNLEYSHQSGRTFKRLPLTTSASIVNANALTTNWEDFIAPSELNFILGNPPFVGSKMMTSTMREELLSVFPGAKGVGVLDFVSAWYAKAATYMQGNKTIQTALVSTNSITQGEQVSVLWKPLFEKGIHINFAHQTFKWSNEGKNNAAVYCVIVGFSYTQAKERRIFEYADIRTDANEVTAERINAYLLDAPAIFIESRSKPICDVPEMVSGNKPIDGGHYLFTPEEKAEFLEKEPYAEKLFKRWLGGYEFLNNVERWCLYVKNTPASELRAMPHVLERIKAVQDYRKSSSSIPTQKLADYPREFHTTFVSSSKYIALPQVSSENRDYIPMAFLNEEYLCGDKLRLVDDATLYHFGVLTSRMHMAWMRTVTGRLKSDYQYSKKIVYNNFIWPEVSGEQKVEIESLAQNILDVRTKFPNSNLADLYNQLTMPSQLLNAHRQLDAKVDKLYRGFFSNDSERVATLFNRLKDYE